MQDAMQTPSVALAEVSVRVGVPQLYCVKTTQARITKSLLSASIHEQFSYQDLQGFSRNSKCERN